MIYRFILLLCLPVFATAQIKELPVKTGVLVPPLASLQNADLQSALELEIYKNKSWKQLVNQERMAVGVVDLSNLDNVKYAGLNSNHMMYAASLPKIAILLAAMDAIDKDEIEYTPAVKKDLRLMISKSNNQASTRMIDMVTYEKIEEVLTSPRHLLYDRNNGGGLWVGKRYAAGGRRYPDPIKGLSHAATVKQVCSFYYQLVFGNLISPERSKEMLGIMVNPGLHHKFVNTLDRIAPKAKVYRKSGSWKNFHADSVLVWGPKRKYIIVALIDNNLGEQIIRDLVVPIEKTLKKSKAIGIRK